MGYGLATNVLIAFLVGFFPVVINTTVGLDAVEEDLLDLVKYPPREQAPDLPQDPHPEFPALHLFGAQDLSPP